MELIYTDSTGKELDFVLNANIDMEIGEDEKDSINDFEVEYKRSDWTGLVEFGSQMYVPDMEESYRNYIRVQNQTVLQ